MAYGYLLDLHKLIDQRLSEAGQSVENTENDPGERRFHEGRIEILSVFKDFLTENLNTKLPRRIRESYFGMK
ncbi:MAG: hypothetical protein V3U02_07850 [Calditrichia bacterium]